MRPPPLAAALALALAACAGANEGLLNRCIPVAAEDLTAADDDAFGGQTLACSAYRIEAGAIDEYRARYPDAFEGVALPWAAPRPGGG